MESAETRPSTIHPSLKRSNEKIAEGKLGWTCLKFGFPLAIGMGLQTTFNLVDLYMISALDANEARASIGALGTCDNLSAIGSILSYGMSIAAGTIVSRRLGEGKEKAMHAAAWQSLILIAFLSVAFALLGLFGSSWLVYNIIGARGAVAALSTQYLSIMLTGSFSIFLLLHFVTLQRSMGSSKTPIIFLLASNVLNFLLDALLVYGPGEAPSWLSWAPLLSAMLHLPRMGLLGAAWATVIARCLTLLPLLLLMLSKYHLFRSDSWSAPNYQLIKRIGLIGWPTSSQLVVRISAIAFINSLVNRYFGETEIAAVAIAQRVETMALFVGLGWGSAVQTFVGQNLGSGRPLRALHSGWWMAGFNAAMMGGFAVVCLMHGTDIALWFSDDIDTISATANYLTTVSPGYIFLGVGIVLGSAIQGSGDTMLTFIVDSLVILLIQVPIALLVMNFGDQTPHTLWQVIAVTYLLFAMVYVTVYRRGSFLKKTL